MIKFGSSAFATANAGWGLSGGGSNFGASLFSNDTRILTVESNGGAGLGTTYSGNMDFPDNGFIIEGNVGIGTTAPNNTIQVVDLISFDNSKFNTSLGYQAGNNAMGGQYNTFIGYQSGFFSTTTGSQNTATGYQAAYNDYTSANNTANGYKALYSNTKGVGNTAIGSEALYNNWYAMGFGNPSSFNTAVGYQTLYSVTTGKNNTAIGSMTGGGIVTGSNNTILGANVSGLDPALSNNIIIADGEGNQRINVDNAGNVGIGTTAPSRKFTLRGTQFFVGADEGPVNSPNYYDSSTLTTNTAKIFSITAPRYQDNADPASSSIGLLQYYSINASTHNLYIGGAPSAGIATENPTNIVFSTVNTERMRVDSYGNVGIGTTAPQGKLHIASGYATSGLSTSLGGGTGTFYFAGGGASPNAGQLVFGDNSGWRFNIGTSNSGTFIERVTILDTGKIGIGTTSPFTQLANTASNIIATEGTGLNGSNSLAWLSNQAGYVVGLQNSSASVGANGLLIRTTAVDTGSYLISADSNNINRFTVRADGNVGIGTTAPGYKLEVQGTSYFNGTMGVGASTSITGTSFLTSGFIAVPAWLPYGDVNLSVKDFNGATRVTFVTQTTDPNLGNIGIGTTSPNSKLEINGAFTGSRGQLSIVSDTNYAFQTFYNGATYMGGVGAIDGSMNLYNYNGGAGGSLIFSSKASSGESMRITTAGNVGIGTTAPEALLDVGGSNRFMVLGGATPTGYARVQASGGPFYANNSGGQGFSMTSIAGDSGTFQNDGASTWSLAYGSGFSGLGTPVLTWNNSGKVGIGTTAPDSLLDVNGGVTIGNGTSFGLRTRANNNNGSWSILYGDGVNNVALDNRMGADVWFGSGGVEKMRVTSGGNVGIGTTSPGYVLQVGGTGDIGAVNFRSLNGGTEVGRLTSNTGELALFAGTGNFITFYTNGANERVRISATGFVGIGMTDPSVALDVTGDIEYTGTITDVSDMRLKENIQDFGSGLNIIKGVTVKTFNMTGSTKNETGFIAQNIKEIFPEAVSIVDPANGYMGVSYVSFIPVLTKAVQELNTNLESLTLPVTTENITQTFAERFFGKLALWLGEAGNGVKNIFADKATLDQICLKDVNGVSCYTRSQLDTLLSGSAIVSTPAPASTPNPDPVSTPAPDTTPAPSPDSTPPTGSGQDSTPPQPDPTPVVDPAPTIDSVPIPEPIPDPAPAPVSDPAPAI